MNSQSPPPFAVPLPPLHGATSSANDIHESSPTNSSTVTSLAMSTETPATFHLFLTPPTELQIQIFQQAFLDWFYSTPRWNTMISGINALQGQPGLSSNFLRGFLHDYARSCYTDRPLYRSSFDYQLPRISKSIELQKHLSCFGSSKQNLLLSRPHGLIKAPYIYVNTDISGSLSIGTSMNRGYQEFSQARLLCGGSTRSGGLRA